MHIYIYIYIRTKTGPLCQQVEVLYSKTVTRIAGQQELTYLEEHVGLLPLWFKPWVYCRYGLSPIVSAIPLVLLGYPSLPKLDPLANEPTSLHWRFGGLWVGLAPQRDGGMGAAFERRLAYMHIYALDESTVHAADI